MKRTYRGEGSAAAGRMTVGDLRDFLNQLDGIDPATPVKVRTRGMGWLRWIEPMSACPYVPSDPQGHGWRQGWITAEAERRHAAGTFGATPEEHARAIAGFGRELAPDPYPELLDRPAPVVRQTAVDPDQVRTALQAFADQFASTFAAGAEAVAEAWSQIVDAWPDVQHLLEQVEAPSEQAHRRREREMLATARRSHRRTNRIGPRPGR